GYGFLTPVSSPGHVLVSDTTRGCVTPSRRGPRTRVRRVRILVWHGYLLGGTGSNVYTRALAREWSRDGHDVTVVCQERHPERYDTGSARIVVPELPAA